MADQSSYSIEERLVASVWVNQKLRTQWSWSDIRVNFELQFNKKAPNNKNLSRWENKVFRTGSVLDSNRSGRPKTRLNHLEAIQLSV